MNARNNYDGQAYCQGAILTLVAEMIRDWMVYRDLTQTQLAEMVGVSQSAVSKWITAGQVPAQRHVQPLAKALGIKTLWLLAAISGDVSEARLEEMLPPLHQRRRRAR